MYLSSNWIISKETINNGDVFLGITYFTSK